MFYVQEFDKGFNQLESFSNNFVEAKIAPEVLWRYAEAEEKKKNYETAVYFLMEFLKISKNPQERAKARAKILTLAANYEKNFDGKSMNPSNQWAKSNTSYLILIITIQCLVIFGLSLLFIRNKLSKSKLTKIQSVNAKSLPFRTIPKIINCTKGDFTDLEFLLKIKSTNI